MKKFLNEFKEFITKGNVLDMAVGVIIGAAFKDIVTSLTDNIISPILAIFGEVDFSAYAINLRGDNAIKYGAFITSVINFIIMAFIIFLIVKGVAMIERINIKKLIKKDEEENTEAVEEPTQKICPFCKSEIAIDATRCPHCTSQLEE